MQNNGFLTFHSLLEIPFCSHLIQKSHPPSPFTVIPPLILGREGYQLGSDLDSFRNTRDKGRELRFSFSPSIVSLFGVNASLFRLGSFLFLVNYK